MELNLKKIFLSQQKLNEVILKKANKSYDEVKNELKLALLVELAELANEVKSFKYWSTKGPSSKEVILDEYADGLHFIASFCILYKIKPIIEIGENNIQWLNNKEITIAFNKLFKLISKINFNKKPKKLIKKIISNYYLLGFYLGYNEQDIENAYFSKHETNYKRQENNY